MEEQPNRKDRCRRRAATNAQPGRGAEPELLLLVLREGTNPPWFACFEKYQRRLYVVHQQVKDEIWCSESNTKDGTREEFF